MYEPIENMRLDHVGIVVKNIEEAIDIYLKFRRISQHPKIDIVWSQGVRVGFFNEGTVNIEFIEPVDKSSKVYNFILNHPYGGLHHLCYEVDDIDKVYERCKKLLKCIAPKCIGYMGYTVAFYVFRDPGCGFRLVELVEKK